MTIDPTLWPKLHGASTHFPLALAMAAALFEGLGVITPRSSRLKERLQSAGYFAIILGALGTIPAVLSGLFLTKGEALGHGALLFHHLFVWPAFTLLVILGVWRLLMGDKASGRGFVVYIGVLFLTAALMAGAGYWGGELILNGAGESVAETVTPEMIAQGHQFYDMSCSHCHAADGSGDEGPDLRNLTISNARIAITIKKGIKGEMPTFEKKYNDAQIGALTAYLRTLH
jgi:uncharacterized membrane protein